jgi:hypothetical protein
MKSMLRTKVVSGLLMAVSLFVGACGTEDDIVYDGEKPTEQALANCSEIIVDSYNVYCYRGTWQYVEHIRRFCGRTVFYGHRIVHDTGDRC